MPRVVAVIGAVLVALALVTAGHTQAPAPQPPPQASVSITSLVDQTVALFPQLDGDVVEAQGDTVTLSVGRKAGAQPGITLEVVREGREIRHPKTGVVLGKAEEAIGRVTITQVFDGYSLASAERADTVKPGDRVRTGSSRVKLALLPLRAPGMREPLVDAANNEVYDALNRSGRFQLAAGDAVGAWLLQEKITPEEFMSGRRTREVLQRYKIDNLLVLHYTMVERKPFVDARVFSATRPDALLTAAFFVPPSIKPNPREQFSSAGGANAKQNPPPKQQSLLARLLGIESDTATYSSGEGALALKEVAKLNFVITGMDVSASGDGIPRMALSDGEKIYVYRIVNRNLEPDWTYSTFAIGKIISVQLADVTGDGKLSVIANRFDTRVDMNSFIVGVKNGKPVVLADQIDSLLYAVDDKGTGIKQTIWAQRYREESFFTRGQADVVVLKNGSMVRQYAAPVPGDFRATGATFSNIAGKTSRGLAYIDAQSRLRVHSGTEEIWRSNTSVGGGGVKIEVVRMIERGGRSYFYQMEPTPLAIDLDGDGIQEIVVPQNKDENGTIAVVYRTAAGIRFQQVKSGFEGVIGGFGALPSDDTGQPTLITAVVKYRSFLRKGGETSIIMTGE